MQTNIAVGRTMPAERERGCGTLRLKDTPENLVWSF